MAGCASRMACGRRLSAFAQFCPVMAGEPGAASMFCAMTERVAIWATSGAHNAQAEKSLQYIIFGIGRPAPNVTLGQLFGIRTRPLWAQNRRTASRLPRQSGF